MPRKKNEEDESRLYYLAFDDPAASKVVSLELGERGMLAGNDEIQLLCPDRVSRPAISVDENIIPQLRLLTIPCDDKRIKFRVFYRSGSGVKLVEVVNRKRRPQKKGKEVVTGGRGQSLKIPAGVTRGLKPPQS